MEIVTFLIDFILHVREIPGGVAELRHVGVRAAVPDRFVGNRRGDALSAGDSLLFIVGARAARA